MYFLVLIYILIPVIKQFLPEIQRLVVSSRNINKYYKNIFRSVFGVMFPLIVIEHIMLQLVSSSWQLNLRDSRFPTLPNGPVSRLSEIEWQSSSICVEHSAPMPCIRRVRSKNVMCVWPDSTAAWLAQMGERRSAEREAPGLNSGQTNAQGAAFEMTSANG